MYHYVLLGFVGWGLSSAFWMHIWRPDPPPDALHSFISTSLAGILGSMAGGAVHGVVSSDPMPALASVLAGSLIAVGGLRAVMAKGRVGK